MLFGKSKNKNFALDQHPYSDLPILIACGMGRSGTTVLRNCISMHPDVDCLNREANYIQGVLRQAHLDIEQASIKHELPVNESIFWRMHQQLILHLHWPVESTNAEPKKALATYSCLDPRGALGLQKSFSKASICYIIRNGIEVVSSYRSFKNFAHMTFRQVCETWKFQKHMVDFIESNPKNCTLIRYEWLNDSSTEFEQALTKAFAKLKIGFSPKCLEPLSTNYHPTKSPGETREQAQDRNQRSERWKSWSDEDREIFTECCSELMDSLGYEIPWK